MGFDPGLTIGGGNRGCGSLFTLRGQRAMA
jgi:hypothetical protein